jgi:microsomal epoxide hydrolase
MIYLVTRNFATASWLYRGFFDDGPREFPPGTRVEVPVGVAAFPGDEVFETPPRGFVEKAYNVRRWSEMPGGGHFAALEEPELFVEDVRAFARDLR